ncbi:metallophosphoesterase family protein [Lentiprolixibacter aurantiacus]|uniref:Phosphoesterase n=1 Tax=Lentiprolixibacter aurantiacus TaxID=2993939 RepID=A0AAE3SN83_9FLAO|nr:YfcE family phosphodiesterase [Lentiprolixibacter aurantiacus]MCX2719071.1 YfcE family phosphodiesterase [Lentiprolixibacter aurantiacus]
MKLAILSDIHDHVWNLNKALAMPALQNTDALLFCGDLCAPFIIHLLGQGYPNPIHMVLGNNDGDVNAIINNLNRYPHMHLHGEYFRGEFNGKTVAMSHYPDKAQKLAGLGIYDIVCYGHNHTLKEEKTGATLLLNPGPIMGFQGGSLEEVPATFMVIGTSEGHSTVHEL